MNHEIFPCRDGSWTLKERASGQSMHSEIGAWREAQEIYIRPAGFQERLRRPGPSLVVYDLGLGIAANALAALDEWRSTPGPKRGLKIVSFERDPEGLALALSRVDRPAFLGEEARCLLSSGRWETDEVSWELRLGDFAQARLQDGEAELVFHDFYVPKVSPELWDRPTFERLKRAMNEQGLLLTYSAAGSVRRALKEAGFHVVPGPGTELKRESTHAMVQS